ncbi:MAG: hypothetical protein AUJ97_05640 [Bacteroidetes bacterium CG2_30_32_10]|nr:MAG: hypothetical protein AUJ97_05640 [Bacteroidetes bacterium CG2_30_32_10]
MKSIFLKRIVFVIIACNVVLYSCKKTYPEGPRISFRDINVRLTGEWEATSLTIKGQDKLYIIDSLNVARYRFQFPKRAPEWGSKYTGGYVAIDKQGNDIRPDTAFNICGFNDKDKNSLFFMSNGLYPKLPKPIVFFPNYFIYTHLISEKWKILRLTYKEMKLQSLEYDITIEMKKVKELRVN